MDNSGKMIAGISDSNYAVMHSLKAESHLIKLQLLNMTGFFTKYPSEVAAKIFTLYLCRNS
jgi:hypothetical protein